MFIIHWLIHKSMKICIVDTIWPLSSNIQKWSIPSLLNYVLLHRFYMDLMIRVFQLKVISKINPEKLFCLHQRPKELMHKIMRHHQHQKEIYMLDLTSLITRQWLLQVLWKDLLDKFLLNYQVVFHQLERIRILVHK